MQPEKVVRIINRKRYSTENATLLAHDAYWDGNNHERKGRNRFLYRTSKGNYFTVSQSHWQGEFTELEPIDQDEAIMLFECSLLVHEVAYAEAFPDVTMEEA